MNRLRILTKRTLKGTSLGRRSLSLQARVSASEGSGSQKEDEDEKGQRGPAARELCWAEEFRQKHYVPLTPLQKGIITVGSGLMAFLDPTKAGTSNLNFCCKMSIYTQIFIYIYRKHCDFRRDLCGPSIKEASRQDAGRSGRFKNPEAKAKNQFENGRYPVAVHPPKGHIGRSLLPVSGEESSHSGQPVAGPVHQGSRAGVRDAEIPRNTRYRSCRLRTTDQYARYINLNNLKGFNKSFQN